MNNAFLYNVICNISDSTFNHYKNFWENINSISDPISASSIYHGSAGLALFEADFYRLTGSAQHLKRAKIYLNDAYNKSVSVKAANPGLFIGLGGITWAISRFPSDLIKVSLPVIKATNKENIDIFYGKAGIGLNYIQKYIISKESVYLRKALEIANDIISLAEVQGLISTDGISERTDEYYGFAHGIAGIAYFLYELFKFTKNKKILDMVHKIGIILINKKSEKHGNITWPKSRENDDIMPYWCHGLAGIGLTFSQLANLGEPYRTTLLKVAESLEITSTGVTSYGLCHGLAGVGETFIEIEKVFGSNQFNGKNIVLKYIMEDMDKDSKGDYIFGGSDEESHYTELMIGHPGIAHFLMRCIDSSIPHFSLIAEDIKPFKKDLP